MEFDKLDQFGPLFIGEAKIVLPTANPEISPEEEIKLITTEALRQVLPLMGSGADELTDTGLTYKQLNEVLERLNK